MTRAQLDELWQAARILEKLRHETSLDTEEGRKIDDLASLTCYLAQHQESIQRGDLPVIIAANRGDWAIRVKRMEKE